MITLTLTSIFIVYFYSTFLDKLEGSYMNLIFSILITFFSSNVFAENITPQYISSSELLTHKESVQFCSDLGRHLPSAREWAVISVTLGAKGIVSSCDNFDRSIYFCHTRELENSDGTKDTFDYVPTGIRSSSKPHIWAWSSSIILDDPQDTAVFFSLTTGQIGSTYIKNFAYAVCVANP
jgi:hypothetical protein